MTPPGQAKELYTAQEVATIAGLSLLTIYRHLESGQLIGKKVGRQWRINAKSLRLYLGYEEI